MFPERVDKPWGFEEIWHCGRYVVKRLHVNAGQRLSLQYHREKVETLIVHAGAPHVTLGETAQTYGVGDVIHVPAGTVHRIAAPDGDVDIFEASTTELEDVVRLADDYQRADAAGS